MKSLVIAAFVFGMSAIAHAQGSAPTWLEYTAESYVLAPIDGVGIDLLATIDTRTHQPTVNIMRFGLDRCAKGQVFDMGKVGIYTVNGQMIRFHGICDNGTELDMPISEEGRAFLNAAASKESTVTLTIEFMTAHFQTRGYSKAVQKLLAAQHAL